MEIKLNIMTGLRINDELRKLPYNEVYTLINEIESAIQNANDEDDNDGNNGGLKEVEGRKIGFRPNNNDDDGEEEEDE